MIHSKTDNARPIGGLQGVLSRFERARSKRRPWEPMWQDCYAYALPQCDPHQPEGGARGRELYDATAADAVDQLAASLLAELTPPWSRWFAFHGGPDLSESERSAVAPVLEDAAQTLKTQFDRSNFAVEVHQCFLDLVTVGTAALLFEEAPAGSPSAFRFTAMPVTDLVLDESTGGGLDVVYRHFETTAAAVRARCPKARFTVRNGGPETRLTVLEAVEPYANGVIHSMSLLAGHNGDKPVMLMSRHLSASPFLCFRWLKAPGEIYGRSPVMKALPDIKTANKVVELVLKNASIAVTGMWQADDDGVVNLANIRLAPGVVIPRAVGSRGLTPLEAPGRFDVSQLILGDLRKRIRHALLADRLAQIDAPRMTATEVLERSGQMARILGATYGRLQGEFLTPLALRGVSLLRRRGDIPDLTVDGRLIDLSHTAPLSRQQAREDARNALLWMESLGVMGPQALAVLDAPTAARWLARALGVPADLLRDPIPEAAVEPVPPPTPQETP